MGKRKSVQLLIIMLLVIALGFTSTAAFAYWSSTKQLSNVTINFTEENANLIVNQTSDQFEGVLVPEKYVMLDGEAGQVEITYSVQVDKTLVKEVNLIVEASNVLINNSNEYSNLVKISINGENIKTTTDLFNEAVTVTVVVTLDEPIDANEANELGLDSSYVNVDNSVAAFTAIHGQTISFDLTFTVEPKETA